MNIPALLLLLAWSPASEPAAAQGAQGAQGAQAAPPLTFTGEYKPSTNVLSLWSRKPATKFTEAYPVGNGRLGATMFASVPVERIVLNESSMWSGSPQDADRKGAAAKLPEIQKLLADMPADVRADWEKWLKQATKEIQETTDPKQP